jgi:hypothetical protein
VSKPAAVGPSLAISEEKQSTKCRKRLLERTASLADHVDASTFLVNVELSVYD